MKLSLDRKFRHFRPLEKCVRSPNESSSRVFHIAGDSREIVLSLEDGNIEIWRPKVGEATFTKVK